MVGDPLNFFTPFRRLEPNHENQLTRALLVVLKLSPMAHSAWLDLVDHERSLHQLPQATYTTQRRAVRDVGGDVEHAELISVFLTPEAPLGDGVMTETDRGQVLDAVIDYGGELLVVVENKVAEDTDRQSREVNLAGSGLQLAEGQTRVVVLWRDVLEALAAVREPERNLVAGAEAQVLDGFLLYTEDHFPALGPFRTLALAKGNRGRQNRRLRQLLGESAQAESLPSAYGPYIALSSVTVMGANAYLRVAEEGGSVELSLFPADTLSQAREFYGRPEVLAGLRDLLEREGWEALPNFHFGHMQRGYCWTWTDRPLDEYIALWTEKISSTGAVARDEWPMYWAWLEAERLARPADRTEFDRHFTETQRRNASPRPGLCVRRRWSLPDAEALDARGLLGEQVRSELAAVLGALDDHRSGADTQKGQIARALKRTSHLDQVVVEASVERCRIEPAGRV